MTLLALVQPLTHSLLAPIVLYVGPDAFLPLTSALAAVTGVVLMFWNKLVGLGRKLFQTKSRPKE
jgi:hypothetical protein